MTLTVHFSLGQIEANQLKYKIRLYSNEIGVMHALKAKLVHMISHLLPPDPIFKCVPVLVSCPIFYTSVGLKEWFKYKRQAFKFFNGKLKKKLSSFI